MPRPPSEHYELSETEKRELIKRIEQAKPLPERYRFLPFEDKREVELTDFSVYYSQGVADAIAAEMKAGKSEVVCETGQLAKLSKDKQGIVTRETLTKRWTDWVDYWAVDFDYESRKEVVSVPKQMGVEGGLPGVVSSSRPDNFAPPRIVIGHEAEPVTDLSIQGWRVPDGVQGWGSIRRLAAKCSRPRDAALAGEAA